MKQERDSSPYKNLSEYSKFARQQSDSQHLHMGSMPEIGAGDNGGPTMVVASTGAYDIDYNKEFEARKMLRGAGRDNSYERLQAKVNEAREERERGNRFMAEPEQSSFVNRD